MSLSKTRLIKHLFSKIDVQALSGERVHSISKIRCSAQGGKCRFLKKIFRPPILPHSAPPHAAGVATFHATAKEVRRLAAPQGEGRACRGDAQGVRRSATDQVKRLDCDSYLTSTLFRRGATEPPGMHGARIVRKIESPRPHGGPHSGAVEVTDYAREKATRFRLFRRLFYRTPFLPMSPAERHLGTASIKKSK